jgi:L-alanine-DL-glutamate epimerase-like enolase superfamily enzyme
MLAPGALDLAGAPGAGASKVRTDMTLSAIADAADIPRLVATAVEHTDAGLRTIKVKVGKADAAGGLDVDALRAVRDAVGPAVTLRADANQGWTPEQAVDVIRAWEDAGLGIELVEQPVNRDDLDGLAFVTERVNTSVLADESVWTVRDAREVIARRAADLVNIKLAKTGGIREALSLLRVANEAGVPAIVGCMMESHVGIAAAAAVAAAVDAASGAPTAHDLDAGLWLSASPVLGGVRYDGQTVTMPDRPGLGILGLRADDPVHRNGSAGSAE